VKQLYFYVFYESVICVIPNERPFFVLIWDAV